MEPNRFDVWIQTMAFAVPRRAVLGGALGVAFTALLARFGADDAMAKRKKKKRKKKKTCRGATPTKCGAACVNTRTNPGHCGDCDQACDTGELCLGGACFVPCTEGTSSCGTPPSCPGGGSCVNVGGQAVCANLAEDCEPHVVDSCDGNPCPVGRACTKLCCGAADFFCTIPA